VPRARDSQGARNLQGLGRVIILTALTTEVLEHIGTGESFPTLGPYHSITLLLQLDQEAL